MPPVAAPSLEPSTGPAAPQQRQGSRPKPHARATVKHPKARYAGECQALEQLPNIGPSLAAELRSIGILHPRELAGRDAFVLYQQLCVKTGKRQDPCVLDTFLAVTDFMRGASAQPWWAYTRQRKAVYGSV